MTTKRKYDFSIDIAETSKEFDENLLFKIENPISVTILRGTLDYKNGLIEGKGIMIIYKDKNGKMTHKNIPLEEIDKK